MFIQAWLAICSHHAFSQTSIKDNSQLLFICSVRNATPVPAGTAVIPRLVNLFSLFWRCLLLQPWHKCKQKHDCAWTVDVTVKNSAVTCSWFLSAACGMVCTSLVLRNFSSGNTSSRTCSIGWQAPTQRMCFATVCLSLLPSVWSLALWKYHLLQYVACCPACILIFFVDLWSSLDLGTLGWQPQRCSFLLL